MPDPNTPDKWDDDDIMDDPFLPDGLVDEEQPWRGLEHPTDWPEDSAGPEYWLYKGMLDAEDDEDV
jgi:hypothetical protein